ncbi:MAG TPA: glycosyltransferase family A protein [Rhizomicrobium sp.]|nr:glycosyltransferase family A protein [Rhizomicrobium sp.]
MTPETSVIIPVRNGARFVGEAILSVRQQLGPDDEIIAVDDASTDATTQVLAAIADPRLRLLHGAGCGVSAARNLGLAAARGEFVAFLDHDDLWPPARHHALRDALLAQPAHGASFGKVRVRFEPGAPQTADVRGMDGRHIWWLVGSGLFRRTITRDVGGFCEDMPVGEDGDFHLRLCEAGLEPLLCEAEGLVYRRHETNITNDSEAVRRGLADLFRRKLARQASRKPQP